MFKKTGCLFLIALSVLCILVSCDGNPGQTETDAFRVGNTYFSTLSEAVSFNPKAAKASEFTVVLVRNVSDAGAVIEKDVTLDFGPYTYTLSGSSTGIVISEGSSVTLNGGTFKASRDNNAEVHDLFLTSGTLQMSSTVVDASGSGLNALNAASGEVSISSGTRITADYNRNAVEASGTSSVTVDSEDTVLTGCLTLSDDAEVNLGKSNLNLTDNIRINGNAVLNKDEANVSISVPAPTFSVQPEQMILAPSGKNVEITCSAASEIYDVKYQWYSSTDGTRANAQAIENEDSSVLVLEPFTVKGTYYYYCTAVNVLTDTENNTHESSASSSEIIHVAYTGLPTVYIETPDHVGITSKTEWIEGAKISIDGASKASWNFEDVDTSIKGRGNSSWSRPKKPYAIKLNKGKEILGMPKHKRWVLIANYLDNSFMRNSLAFYLSDLVNMDYTVDGKFVDLVINGQYQGLYWLGEAIKVDDDRVNIDENEDFLIELDRYYDETWKFKSSVKNLPYMIKNDDSMTDERLSFLSERIKNLENLLYGSSVPNEEYTNYLDVDSWAKFWIVNELMGNVEVRVPRSCFATFNSTTGVLKAGPVWDFDWSSRSVSSTCQLKNALYYDALFKYPAFKNAVKNVWDSVKEDLINNVTAEINELKTLLGTAREYDVMRWGNHRDSTGINRDNFEGYVNYFKSVLLNKIDVVDEEIRSL